MDNESIIVMDGPGPFYFGRLEGPLRLLPPDKSDAVAIEGEMDVDETGRRVIVRIPLAASDATKLFELLAELERSGRTPTA